METQERTESIKEMVKCPKRRCTLVIVKLRETVRARERKELSHVTGSGEKKGHALHHPQAPDPQSNAGSPTQ